MDKNLIRGVALVFLTCVSLASLVHSNENKKTGTCCSDGLGLNYTLPMFNECKKELHPNGSMIQTIPKLIPYTSQEAACPRRKSKLGIPPGHRICRFPYCDEKPCQKGWCEETMKNFKCHCPAGYRGKRCSKESTSSTTQATTTMLTTKSATCRPPTTTQSTTTQDTTTMPTTKATTSHPTTTIQSTTTQDTTTMPTTKATTSHPRTTIPSTARQETVTMSPLESTTSHLTTTTQSTTTQDTTTMSTTEATTSHPKTTIPSTTTQDTTTMSTTESTTSHPTATTQSTTTQDTPTMSTTKATTSHPKTTIQSTAKIFVTDKDSSGIFVADLQGDLEFSSIPSTIEPRYITYDPLEKKIYWTDKGEKRVYRADVDGENREEVTSASNDELRGIAIDKTSRTLYIAITGQKKIISVSIAQGTSSPRAKTDFISGQSEELFSLEVDEEKGFLYWSMKTKIQRKPLNGSGSTETIYTNSQLSEITGLSIDLSRNPRRIFFCDFDKKRSFYTDVNQSPKHHELTDKMNDPDISDGKEQEKLRDISFFNGILYWAKEDGPGGIAVMTEYDQSSPSFDIKETSVVGKPYQLLITNVDPR